jgi:hypothetical protein
MKPGGQDLPILKVPFLVVISISSNWKFAIANATCVRFVARVCAHVRNHCWSLKGIESASFALVASRAEVLHSSVQVDWLNVEL